MKKFILALALVATSLPLSAAEDDDLPSLVNKGLQAMNEGNWEQALALNAEAVERFGGETALQLHGPQFGVIWFRKGISELKLKKYEDAMKSFEATYKDFPNEGSTKGKNIFNKQALLKWGEAAMAAGQYELAIEKWKKFIQERDKARDSYPQGAFHINLAISFFRLGQMEDGIEHLEISIKNKDTFPTPRAAIVSGFQALVAAAISAKDEQTVLDFIAKNRGELIVEPFEMQRFSKLFMKLAGDAIAAKMPKLALNLYQFVPSTQVAIDDLRAKTNAMGAIPRFADGSTQLDKTTMEKELTALEAEQRSSKSIEMIKLAAIAYLHEANGYVPGAYAAYLQLETHFPKAEKREDNLYNLVRTSSILGDVQTTKKYGELFSKQFANSEHNANVQKMLLSSLFFDGKYETSIEIASDIVENNKAKEGTPEHDLAVFVLGGSYFYTGQYEKAEPLLDQHVEKYPESVFALTSAYFQASNTSRLQLWTKAASQLDAFLSKYSDAKDQTYIPLALYDRANAHYSEEQPDGSLEKLDRIIKEFPDSPITDQAYNLKGNVMQGEENLEEAEKSYKKALELAEARGHGGVAGEALYYLVALIGDQPEGDDSNEKLKEAVPFADLYWEKYSDGSPYNAQMAVAQLAPMSAAGRDDESLERLQKVISTMAKLPEAYGLEAAINSYTEAYLKKYTPEELKEHYYNFPGISVQDKAARALLRIAVIGVFEKVAENNENADKQRAAKAMIQVLFRNLKEDFEFKDLSNYILVKLGDYLRTNTSAPREAVPYYDEALQRSDKSYNFAALLGRADVYGNSSQDTDLNKALEDFERIFKESDEKGQREFALFRIIEVLMKKGDYAKAADRANEYLNRDKNVGEVHGFTKFSPEVGYILAKTFEERDMVDDAISMYVKVWSAHMGYVTVSAPAIEAWMKLSHKRNNQSSDPKIPSDRQGAYEGGHRYIELTGRFKDKLSPSDLKLWEEVEKLTETYEADPNIKSVEQIKKEKEEAAKRR